MFKFIAAGFVFSICIQQLEASPVRFESPHQGCIQQSFLNLYAPALRTSERPRLAFDHGLGNNHMREVVTYEK